MAPSALSTLVAVASASYVAAQTLTFAATPLNQLNFPKPTDAPNQVYPASQPYIRGPQTGTNICNSTTENQNSDCQTMYVNGLDDFCLWAPGTPNSTIADTEGEVVAWCTKKGHGTRRMLNGTIKGAQLLKSNDYWMITGIIDQTLLDIQDGDYGGELDSGGQDGRGNPIGGLLYSTAFDPTVGQIKWWTEFIGSNQFCIKICNPEGNNNPGYCQHTLDRIGLGYNCPSKYTLGGGFQPGEFEVCDTADMTVPGIYVQNGVTMSYQQPAESLGAITSIPYEPSAAASSNCVTTASAALFTDLLAAPSTTAAASSATGTAAGSKATGSASGSRAVSAAGSSATGATSHSGATSTAVVSFAAVAMGLVSSIMIFA